MTLGFYTNWSDHDTGYSSLFRPPSPELPPELFAFNEAGSNCINQLFDSNYSTNNLDSPTYSDVPPPITPTATGHAFTPSPEFQLSSFSFENPYHHLPYSTTFNHQLFSHFFTMEYPMAAALPPSEMVPLPEIYQGGGSGGTLCSWYDGGGGSSKDVVEGRNGIEVMGKENGGGGGGVRLSAGSMAARVRRRKISEKTKELGKVIPGGHKMNTAEMFEAAFKYIKFLQAQVGVLKLMASIPEGEQVMDNGELMEALVTCRLVQEKLYTAEKCIVSKHFAETLAIN